MLSLTTQNQIDQEWQRKADAFEPVWERKNVAPDTNSILNDAVRHSFDQIARKAAPFFNIEYAYFSDLLWDASTCARLEVGDELFIMVRDCGTSVFIPHDQSVEAIRAAREDAMLHVDACSTRRAVLRVTRSFYDTFAVSVVYERKERV